MRHDPDPEVLRRARAGFFVDAINAAYRLATGESVPNPVVHRIQLELDDVFGDYDALKIACTAPAAAVLQHVGRLTSREAEMVADLWLHHWRRGRTLNCPKEK